MLSRQIKLNEYYALLLVVAGFVLGAESGAGTTVSCTSTCGRGASAVLSTTPETVQVTVCGMYTKLI